MKTLGFKKLINVLQAFNDVVKVVMQGTTAAGLLPVDANLDNVSQGASKRQRLAVSGTYAPVGTIITMSWEEQYARSMGFASVADAMKYAQAQSTAGSAHGLVGAAQQESQAALAYGWSEYNAWAAQAQTHAALDPAAAATYAHAHANMLQEAAGHAAWAGVAQTAHGQGYVASQ